MTPGGNEVTKDEAESQPDGLKEVTKQPEFPDVPRGVDDVHSSISKITSLVDKERGGIVLSVEDFIKFARSKEEEERIRENFKGLTCIDITDPEKIAFQESMKLYEYAFPNDDEREETSLIFDRIKAMQNMTPELKKQYRDRRFHAVAIINDKNQAVGYAQFTVLPFGGEKDRVVVYGQYVAAADREFMKDKYGSSEHFRRKGVYGSLGMLAPLMAAMDAEQMEYKNGYDGAFIESEMVGQAEDPDEIRFTQVRLNIHAALGAKAVMLELENGGFVSPHMQPKLSEDSDPIQLLMLYRPDDYLTQDASATVEMTKETAAMLENAFLDSLQSEGFNQQSIDEARQVLQDKLSRTKRALLMPVWEVPQITEVAKNDPLLAKQIERDYGCSVEEHAANVKKALEEPTNINAPMRGI